MIGAELLEAVEVVARFWRELSSLSRALEGLAELAQSRWATWVRKFGLTARVPMVFRDALDAVQKFADPLFDRSIVDMRLDHRARRWVAR